MKNQLDKIIQLVRRTGDRMVVLDREHPDSSYVVLGINDYENLIDGCNERDWFKGYEQKDDDEWLPEEDDDFNWREDDDNWQEEDEGIPFNEPKVLENEEFNKPPIIDDDFVSARDILAEERESYDFPDKLDNNSEHGKISDNSFRKPENTGKKRNRWEIAPEVKGENPEEEEDRYYLETI